MENNIKKIKEYLTNKIVVVFALSMVIILLSFSYSLFTSVDNTDEQIVTNELTNLYAKWEAREDTTYLFSFFYLI